MRKLVVIGLDGATFDLLKPLMAEGELPNLKKIMEQGASGVLKSTVPPITGCAWVSFATGTNPGRHGCFDFLLPGDSLAELKPISGSDACGKFFYQYLAEAGKRCVIVNLPGSFPPRIKGTVITSLLTRGENFIFPGELMEEIPELKNYRIFHDRSLKRRGRYIEYVRDVRQLENTRFKCACELFRREWDFFFLLFSGTDWVQHIAYENLLQGSGPGYGEYIRLYREIDDYICWFWERLPEGANLLIMSDHGFKVSKKAFFINAWLRNRGYLEVKTRTGRPQNQLENLKEYREASGKTPAPHTIKFPAHLAGWLKYFTWLYPAYRALQKIVPLELQYDVLEPDFSKTKACSVSSTSSYGAIYINHRGRFTDGIVNTGEYENLADRIINQLRETRDPQDGTVVIDKVWKNDELYEGSRVDKAPVIIFSLAEGYCLHGNLVITGEYDDKITDLKNIHSIDGILAACGPDIAAGLTVEGVTIYDLAPTVLYLMGMAAPPGMDGRVLSELIRPGARPGSENLYRLDAEKLRIRARVRELKAGGRL